MSEKKSVWVIEQGEYSDYEVVGVFSSKENAEVYLALMMAGWDKPSISEWSLDPAITDIREGKLLYHVEIDYDGTVEKCETSGVSKWSTGYDPPIIRHRTRSIIPAFAGKNDSIGLWTWARDEKHAIKIANEKRVALIASGELKARQ